MMRKIGLELVIAMFSISALHAQTGVQSKARLIAVGGAVEVQRNNAWVQTAPGEQLNSGERVRTGTLSSAALELGPGKVITLAERTEIQLGESNGSPIVQLDGGNIKVSSAADIQVAAKDTMLQSVELPLDMQVGLQGGRLDLMVLTGAVRNGALTIRGVEDSSVRTYTADARSMHHADAATYPAFYTYPYFMCANPGKGGISPPAVLNPTNPGYRPDQVVPPMSDPIRPPIQIRPNR